MSVMAIILWALHALSPMRRLQESARHLLATMLHYLPDPRWPAWLDANPDDPSGYPTFERMLDDIDAGIDLLARVVERHLHVGVRLRRRFAARDQERMLLKPQRIDAVEARFLAGAAAHQADRQELV